MADHDERALVTDVGDQAVEDVDRMRVKAGIRLVKEHDRRVVDDSAGNGHALRHALRERAHRVEPAMRKAHHIKQLVHAFLRVGNAVQLGIQQQILLGREVGVQHGLMRDQADELARSVGLFLHVDAHDQRLARRCAQQRGQHAQERGFAGTVGAEDRQESALRQNEADVVNGAARAEHLAQALHFDSRFILSRIQLTPRKPSHRQTRPVSRQNPRRQT